MINALLYLRIALIVVLLAGFLPASAQQFQAEINAYLKQEKKQLTDTDIANYVVSDQYTNRETGVTYTYLHQQAGGLRIFNAVSTMALRDGKVVHFANRFHANATGKVNATQPVLGEQQAIEAAADHLGLTLKETPRLLSAETQRHRSAFSRGGIAREDMTVELLYLAQETALRLAWNVNLAPAGSADWWNIRIDALTGEYLDKNNWTTHCDFGPGHKHGNACGDAGHRTDAAPVGEEKINIGNYNVYALPVEAPLFGDRTLLTDPHSLVASPYGWHDVNGEDGAEYTITRGNNVYVYEDRSDEDAPGYSPDGGPELNFDFPIDLALAPEANLDAILTNLFYMNNMLHDILYVHGFDEHAGNFQATNYNNGGIGSDYVLAEGQDGGGTNNANFSTPEDGFSGRMQMYLWPSDVPAVMQVLSPDTIAGDYFAVEAAFGPGLSSPVTGFALLVEDETSPSTDACNPIINNIDEIAGKIMVIDRGNCPFISKINAVEEYGAIAVIMINNTGGDPISMGGTGTTSIPSVMISQADGELLKAQLLAGQTVEVTLAAGGGALGSDRDGSLDNGIIAHEYGHGLSTRLTGGPSNSGCLFNGEQGGEGWSDWLGLILTIEPGDAGTDSRGIGTYALDDDSGQGIRRFPYSTDMSINPQTYGSLANSNGVHAVGEIWSQVLWEMTWKLIEAEGFDPDWYNGTGGNNTAMRLVIEGMKLQPCGPGYLEARDAILIADQLLYDNAHRCLIWEAFAKRGMGVNALQGSANAVGDETEDFSLPGICLTATIAPTANFAVNTLVNCSGRFSFTDLSTDIPQFYFWDFGDGNTSEAENPTHAYAVPGTYTVTLTVTNNIGTDEYALEVAYATLPAPALSGNTTVCEGGATTLTAAVETGNTAIWSVGGTVVYTGTDFPTPNITAPVTYSVQQLEDKPILNAGPEDNTFGGGGNHNTGFDGQVLFEAFVPLKIVSVFIYAQGAGNRTIRLMDATGEILQSVTVFAPAGPSRVTLNLEVLNAGNYRLSNISENLYRNSAGADYPYNLDGLLSIYSSNATGGNEFNFYYYFYDWEVQESTCLSETTEIALGVAPGPLAAFATASDNLNVNFTDNTSGTPNSWFWNFGDGTPASTEQNPVHSYTEAGTYLVELTVSNGTCSSTYRQEVTVGITGTNNPEEAYGLNVFPNPAGDAVNIELLQAISGQTGLEIRDAAGRLVLSQILRDQRTSINTSSFAAGVYQFRVIGEAGASVRMLTIVR